MAQVQGDVDGLAGARLTHAEFRGAPPLRRPDGLRAIAIPGNVDFGSFHIRRTFRIHPMYPGIIALYCVLIPGLRTDAGRRALRRDSLPFILWFPEHLPFFRTTDVHPAFNGAWSIGTECWVIHRMYEEPMCASGVRLSRRIQQARAPRPEAVAPRETVAV